MKKENLKVLLFAGSLVLFESIIYFICKLSPIEVTVMRSAIDNKIPLVPAFVLFYFLWYIYLFVVPFILYKKNHKYLYKYAALTIMAVIIAGVIYMVFPTIVDRGVNIDESQSIFKYLVKFVYIADTPNLCCFPSLHCASSYIFMYMILTAKEIKKPYKILITLTSFGIVLSTLFIKQHVIWDALASVVLIIICLIINKYTKLDEFIEKKCERLISKK